LSADLFLGLLLGDAPRRRGVQDFGQVRQPLSLGGGLLGGAERGEELLFVAEVDLEEGVDRGLATACQPHEGASAVVGVWAAFDQAGVGKTSSRLVIPLEESSIVCISWVGFSA
jgi:hypothetical protein